LAKIKAVRESLFRLVDVTYRSGSLRSILRLGSDIEAVYEFLKARMLRNVPARIVTVSKALLMIGGFSPGFDTNVLAAIRKSNPYILAASGVWPYCLFQEHLEFLASQQTAWEKQNGRMKDLRPGVPIGQIMDRILWS
jgi:hypothetical protein